MLSRDRSIFDFEKSKMSHSHRKRTDNLKKRKIAVIRRSGAYFDIDNLKHVIIFTIIIGQSIPLSTGVFFFVCVYISYLQQRACSYVVAYLCIRIGRLE